MDISEISDRMELEKLVTDYATAVDTKNFKEFNNLFTQVGDGLARMPPGAAQLLLMQTMNLNRNKKNPIQGFTNYPNNVEHFANIGLNSLSERNCGCGVRSYNNNYTSNNCKKCCNYFKNFNKGNMNCTTDENKNKPLCKTVRYYKSNYHC